MIKAYGTFALAALLVGWMATAAAALEPPRIREGVTAALNQVWGACRGDLQRVCKGVRPGGGRLIQCMRSHQEQISGGCKSNLDRVEQAMSCWADVGSMCKAAGSLRVCLGDPQARLPQSCDAIANRRSASP